MMDRGMLPALSIQPLRSRLQHIGRSGVTTTPESYLRAGFTGATASSVRDPAEWHRKNCARLPAELPPATPLPAGEQWRPSTQVALTMDVCEENEAEDHTVLALDSVEGPDAQGDGGQGGAATSSVHSGCRALEFIANPDSRPSN